MGVLNTGDIIVVKVGTRTLIKSAKHGEELDPQSFGRIGRQIDCLVHQGMRVVLVSSAAITAGMTVTGMQTRPSRSGEMPLLQLLASVGWRHVLNMWASALSSGPLAELLLTRTELDSLSQRQEALSTINTAWGNRAIPVVNENDAISHEEISFGDNDMLAANLAAKLSEESAAGGKVHLAILSDVAGVYIDPSDRSTLLRVFNLSNPPKIERRLYDAHGTGGIVAKIAAARYAADFGVNVVMANGRSGNAVLRVLDRTIGTRFIV